MVAQTVPAMPRGNQCRGGRRLEMFGFLPELAAEFRFRRGDAPPSRRRMFEAQERIEEGTQLDQPGGYRLLTWLIRRLLGQARYRYAEVLGDPPDDQIRHIDRVVGNLGVVSVARLHDTSLHGAMSYRRQKRRGAGLHPAIRGGPRWGRYRETTIASELADSWLA